MKNSDKKAWLSRAQNADDLLESMKESREQIFEQLTSMTASYSGMTGSGNSNPHKMDKLAEYDEKILQQMSEIIRIKTEIQEAIGTVKDLKLREVLQLRYMNYRRYSTWDDIADKMHYSRRQTLTLHGYALTALDLEGKGPH